MMTIGRKKEPAPEVAEAKAALREASDANAELRQKLRDALRGLGCSVDQSTQGLIDAFSQLEAKKP